MIVLDFALRGPAIFQAFWFSNFDGMRRELFPALAACEFAKVGAGETAQLEEIVQRGAAHWERIARQLLASDEAAIEAISHDTAALALA